MIEINRLVDELKEYVYKTTYMSKSGKTFPKIIVTSIESIEGYPEPRTIINLKRVVFEGTTEEFNEKSIEDGILEVVNTRELTDFIVLKDE